MKSSVDELNPEESQQIATSFRRIWAIAFAVAVISTPFVVVFKDRFPWVITVPVLVGTMIVFLVEIFNDGRARYAPPDLLPPAEKMREIDELALIDREVLKQLRLLAAETRADLEARHRQKAMEQLVMPFEPEDHDIARIYVDPMLSRKEFKALMEDLRSELIRDAGELVNAAVLDVPSYLREPRKVEPSGATRITAAVVSSLRAQFGQKSEMLLQSLKIEAHDLGGALRSDNVLRAEREPA